MRAGWRALGLFWAAVIVLAGGSAAALQWAGPPPVAAEPAAASREEPAPAAKPLSPDQISPPVAALLEPSKLFPPAMLPRVGADGRVARVVYARPFDAGDKRPRIGLILTGVGMSEAESRNAIDTLPGAVTLSFSPYAPPADALLARARAAGHETLVSLPLEPQGYPLSDAGSHSLLTGATPQQNAANLEWALGRIGGYVGAIGALDGMRGERFAEQTASLKAVEDDVVRRGLLYVDPRPGRLGKLPTPIRGVDAVVDDPPARAEIEAKLAGLERTARETGAAVGLAGPLRPVTIERIAAWAKGLGDRGIALAPISAMTSESGR